MEALEKYFYDALGGVSLADLLKKGVKLDLSPAQVREFYAEQKVNQVNRQVHNLKRHFLKITAPRSGYISADLMDYSTFSHENKGFKYILTVIDIYSRYAWTFPLKTKSPKDVLPAIKKINEALEEHNYSFTTFTVDYGAEFLGPVKKYLDELDVKIYIAQEKDNSTFKLRTAVVERFNRTISERLTRATFIKDTTTWVDLLPAVTESYNNKVHSAIGRSPASVFLRGKEPRTIITDKKAPNFNPGDTVRYITNTDTFSKRGLRGKNTFSDDIYQVVSREGNRYTLATLGKLDNIPGTFLGRQLLAVPRPKYEEKTKVISTLKKTAKKSKKLTTENIRSGLDVDKEGNIVKPPTPSKRIIKLPSKYHD